MNSYRYSISISLKVSTNSINSCFICHTPYRKRSYVIFWKNKCSEYIIEITKLKINGILGKLEDAT